MIRYVYIIFIAIIYLITYVGILFYFSLWNLLHNFLPNKEECQRYNDNNNNKNKSK